MTSIQQSQLGQMEWNIVAFEMRPLIQYLIYTDSCYSQLISHDFLKLNNSILI
jgi:hypothetical protein